MSRDHAQQYAKPGDVYAFARCVNCRHLRYPDEKPGDPCQWCPCVDHVLPGDLKENADAR